MPQKGLNNSFYFIFAMVENLNAWEHLKKTLKKKLVKAEKSNYKMTELHLPVQCSSSHPSQQIKIRAQRILNFHHVLSPLSLGRRKR